MRGLFAAVILVVGAITICNAQHLGNRTIVLPVSELRKLKECLQSTGKYLLYTIVPGFIHIIPGEHGSFDIFGKDKDLSYCVGELIECSSIVLSSTSEGNPLRVGARGLDTLDRAEIELVRPILSDSAPLIAEGNSSASGGAVMPLPQLEQPVPENSFWYTFFPGDQSDHECLQ